MDKNTILVNKAFLPPLEEYKSYLEQIWDRVWLTNQGPLVIELENKLKQFLEVENLLFVANGTIALQLAIKALQLKGEVITTPFSYVATTTALLWEECRPVFADIDKDSLCINPDQVESLITKNTSAILATHVYGNACDVAALEELGKKYNLKIIFDGAHAFGVNYKGISVFQYGNISTLSFHATKLFHTVEGGGIITKGTELAAKLSLFRSFGHIADDHYSMGINAKNSELHAAMGLCNLRRVNDIIENRKIRVSLYKSLLDTTKLTFPKPNIHQSLNYAYMPIILHDEETLVKIKLSLSSNGIGTRRYFYPSLNELPYLKSTNHCPVSENIAKRVLCLPLYYDLEFEQIHRICKLVNAAL